MSLATFIQASAHDMPQVATGSVQCIVTSPPYYGLRAYAGEQAVEWPAVEYAPMPGLPGLTVPAMRSPLGNEPTLDAYIGHLVLCLREWRRVLRDDGCCFVNLGDSYNGSGGAGGDYNEGGLRSGQPKFKAGKVKSNLYRLRSDLTAEQEAYVMDELAKARRISSQTQEGRE